MRCNWFYLLFLLFVVALSSDPLRKILFSEDYVQKYGSRCLDGTPSGYYLRTSNAPSNSSDFTSWVFFLEGGGLCVEPIDCYERLKTIHGSSTNWNGTLTDNTGFLSTDKFNPFAGFNHVWVPYCSGDTHTGTLRSQDLAGFYFAGHLTLTAICAHLKATTNIENATHILFSGGSAGGIGVFNNADFMSQQFPKAQVKAAPEAGYFFPESLVFYEEWLAGLNEPFPPVASEYIASIFSSYVDETCAKAHPFTSGRCWDAAFVYPYLETPILIVNNIYDSSQLEYSLWLNDGSIDSKAYLGYFGNTLVTSVTKGYNSSKDGYFLTACYDHTGNLCVASQTKVQNLLYSEVVEDWFFGKNELPHILVDSCWHPNGEPCNPVCPSLCG